MCNVLKPSMDECVCVDKRWDKDTMNQPFGFLVCLLSDVGRQRTKGHHEDLGPSYCGGSESRRLTLPPWQQCEWSGALEMVPATFWISCASFWIPRQPPSPLAWAADGGLHLDDKGQLLPVERLATTPQIMPHVIITKPCGLFAGSIPSPGGRSHIVVHINTKKALPQSIYRLRFWFPAWHHFALQDHITRVRQIEIS